RSVFGIIVPAGLIGVVSALTNRKESVPWMLRPLLWIWQRTSSSWLSPTATGASCTPRGSPGRSSLVVRQQARRCRGDGGLRVGPSLGQSAAGAGHHGEAAAGPIRACLCQ